MKRKVKFFLITPFVLLAISLTVIFGFVEPSSRVSDNQVFNNKYQTVIFLSKQNASDYMSDDLFFEQSNDFFDISIRLEKDLSNKTPVENKKLLKDFTLSQTIDWDEKEIIRVYSIIEQAQKKIAEQSPIILQDTLYLIKTSGKENFKAYYTAKKAIVIPKTNLRFLWIPPRKIDVMGTYVHEYMHIFTRQNKAKRDELYNIIGFRELKKFNLPKKLNNRRISNPDFLDLNFAITLKDSLDNISDYALLLTSKYDKYEGKKGFKSFINTLLGYAEVGLYRINKDGTITNKKMSYSKEFFSQVGTISSYRYGADEIIAEAFQELITKDLESKKKRSNRDKEIMREIKHILN